MSGIAWTLVALGIGVIVVRRRSIAVALVTAQAFVLAAYQQILGRVPSTAELTECHLFLRSQAELLHDQAQLTAIPGGAKAAVAASTDPVQRARENLTLVLYNHNDFVTIH